MAWIRVEEVDGVPALIAIEVLQFDQADGFSLSQPAAGVVLVNTSGTPAPDNEARLLALWGVDEIGGL